MTEQIPKWGALGYEPVPGLINKHIARYLRTQRKNMRRFFAERGMVDWFLRLEEIRKDPRRDFMQKNRSFQRILNEYAASVTPVPAVEPETPPAEGAGGMDLHGGPASVAVPGDSAMAVPGPDHVEDAGRGVPIVAGPDGPGPVIEGDV